MPQAVISTRSWSISRNWFGDLVDLVSVPSHMLFIFVMVRTGRDRAHMYFFCVIRTSLSAHDSPQYVLQVPTFGSEVHTNAEGFQKDFFLYR